MPTPVCQTLMTPPASVQQTPEGGFVLDLPESPAGIYRVAQLDDYHTRPRSHFHWTEPVTLSLRARVSRSHHPGTWGFGLWNDPFSLSFGLGGMARRLPALPNAAWFFFASPENHLSFRTDKPAQGFLAQVFSAPRIPSLLLASAALGLPLLAMRPTSSWLRAIASRIISEDSATLVVDATQWHTYRLKWDRSGVAFAVDDAPIFRTGILPRGPLGLVIWIDNQYAAWKPSGRVRLGALAHPAAQLEIEALEIIQ